MPSVQTSDMRHPSASTLRTAPGLAVAGAAALIAWGISAAVPAIPLLTASVALGILVAQLPAARPALTGVLQPGLSVAAKRCMRLGIVMLGLQLSLVDIAALGWVAILGVIGVLLVTFVVTLGLGRTFRLPGQQPVLIAAGFSICGASAIGAMSHATGSDDEEAATPVALVTLCGTLAIAVLPLLWHPLGFTALEFGHWVGASVHDVGQVVATSQVAGSAALAVAIGVKLTRVLISPRWSPRPRSSCAGAPLRIRAMRGARRSGRCCAPAGGPCSWRCCRGLSSRRSRGPRCSSHSGPPRYGTVQSAPTTCQQYQIHTGCSATQAASIAPRAHAGRSAASMSAAGKMGMSRRQVDDCGNHTAAR